MSVKREIEDLEEYVVALRRELHMNPELSHHEEQTARLIERELNSSGIVHRRVGATGVIGEIEGNESDRIILLRADIDALPIAEANKCEYASRNSGVMHACGHDAHTAMLLTAARVLSSHRGELKGNVRLCFQAAEEVGKGAKELIKSGALEGVSRVFGIHTAPDLPIGTVGIKKGSNNASVDAFHLVVKGKASHVATPEKGVDAIYILSEIIVALQALVSRRSSPIEPLVIGVGKISGGVSYNIVAESAEAEGTLRSATKESREYFISNITTVAEEIAKIYGGEAVLEWEDFASPLANDSDVCDELIALLERDAKDINIVTDRPFSLTGDNFSELIESVKGAYLYLGTSNPNKRNTLSAYHTPTFDIDEAALSLGAYIHTLYALWYLGERR